MPSAPRLTASKTSGPSSAMCSLSRMPRRRQLRQPVPCDRETRNCADLCHHAWSSRRHRGTGGRPSEQSNCDKPSAARTTTSPSIVKLLALIRWTAAVIAASVLSGHRRCACTTDTIGRPGGRSSGRLCFVDQSAPKDGFDARTEQCLRSIAYDHMIGVGRPHGTEIDRRH
jgi:hypothetical protein